MTCVSFAISVVCDKAVPTSFTEKLEKHNQIRNNYLPRLPLRYGWIEIAFRVAAHWAF